MKVVLSAIILFFALHLKAQETSKVIQVENKLRTNIALSIDNLYNRGNQFATPINIPSNITGDALGSLARYSPTLNTLIVNLNSQVKKL